MSACCFEPNYPTYPFSPEVPILYPPKIIIPQIINKARTFPY